MADPVFLFRVQTFFNYVLILRLSMVDSSTPPFPCFMSDS
jgi:hypothetical protein